MDAVIQPYVLAKEYRYTLHYYHEEAAMLTVLRKETSSASLSPSAMLAAGENSIYDHFPPISNSPRSQLSIPIATNARSRYSVMLGRWARAERRVKLAPDTNSRSGKGESQGRPASGALSTLSRSSPILLCSHEMRSLGRPPSSFQSRLKTLRLHQLD